MANILKAIELQKPQEGELWRFFPDKNNTYFDCSVKLRSGCYWYYSMHITTVLDRIYEAGKNGWKVNLVYQDGGVNCERGL